jgi:hypothetical protein
VDATLDAARGRTAPGGFRGARDGGGGGGGGDVHGHGGAGQHHVGVRRVESFNGGGDDGVGLYKSNAVDRPLA